MKRSPPRSLPSRKGDVLFCLFPGIALAAALILLPVRSRAASADAQAAARFHQEVQPLLAKYCSDCHEDGAKKGGIAFDEFKSDADLLARRDLWFEVLKNTRAGLMPPEKKPRPTAEEQKLLVDWIKYGAFAIDPANPDPGRVTVRRLNRVEYRNTIRDLTGVDFNTDLEFPADDTGYGFDDIADVLTVSPMLLEKYLQAANSVIGEAVPTVPWVPGERIILGNQFARSDTNVPSGDISKPKKESYLSLPYYRFAAASQPFRAAQAGTYRLLVELSARGNNSENGFDSNRCEVVFKVDGRELLKKDYGWHEGRSFHYELEEKWRPGEHNLSFELTPVVPGSKKISSLEMRVVSVTVRGPMEQNLWVRPKNYERFFSQTVLKTQAGRRAAARQILGGFASKAFRAPVDAKTVDRLTALAEGVYLRPGNTFEAGIAHAMVATLASPRFLFREEGSEPVSGPKSSPSLDQYALASRLSYLLWSSMPDEELFRLAGAGTLRKNLAGQVKRMLADPRSDAFTRNFAGQWLEARDIESVQIDARSVLARENASGGRNNGGGFGFGRPRIDLDPELRTAMRRETELYFDGIVRGDRNVIELIDSDYTYLNERLAKHYGLTNSGVSGVELRRVTLPPDSPRGGILTQGSILAVTSNPTRTSPVKRGLFILENILGSPPPPPPPDIPPLEDAAKEVKDRKPTLRETLELHRSKPLCSSCHSRMDPLGLAFENFNAMGIWREKELNQPIDAAGKLLSGESFANVRELKHILATRHRLDFYRTLTEKLLTYALGRGLEFYDVQTVDQIVERLDRENGRFSALLMGIIESAPFEKRRNPGLSDGPGPVKPPLTAQLK